LIRQAQAAVEAYKGADARVASIRAKIDEIRKALEGGAGATDPSLQTRLLALVAELPAALADAQNLSGQVQKAAQAVQDAKGMPWYGWIVPGLTLALGVAGIYFPALKPAQAALAAEPARQTGEWVAGGLAAALALLAAWQKKKAVDAEKEREAEEARLKTERLELVRAVGDQNKVDAALAKAREKSG
jgi:hypothetical protein